MKRLWLAGLTALLWLTACKTPPDPIVYIEEYNALVRLPKNYEEQDACPAIVFLHGGDCGTRNMDVFDSFGMGYYANENEDDFPFLVIAPQSPESWYAGPLGRLLDDMEQRYKIDTDRIYVTGFSMGGYGTYLLAEAFPHRFAALAPVAGYGDPDAACAYSHLPIWIFHDKGDEVVPYSEAEAMKTAIEACGGTVKLTEYENNTHSGWFETYTNPDLYAWFLDHVRQDP